jgi:hypothetical protein
MTTRKFQKFKSYEDLLKKARWDYQRYYREGEVYSSIDCLLTINLIPRWIIMEEKSGSDSNLLITRFFQTRLD